MSLTQPNELFVLPPEKVESIKSQWDNLMSLALWSDIQSDQIGKVTRARKRLLDLGESFRSYIAPKDWIDQPRQQLKSALGSSIKLRDSITALKSNSLALNKGADVEAFHAQLHQLETDLMELIEHYENLWANELDAMGYED